MLKAGIVGLPNVGKSTLFNAVTRTRKAEAANYPFCTIDPNVGHRHGAGRPAGALSRIAQDLRHHPGGHRVRGYRRPGQRRRPGRRLGQQVPHPHPRSGRHRAGRALLRRPGHPSRGRRHRSGARHRDHHHRTGPGGFGGGAEAARERGQGRQARRQSRRWPRRKCWASSSRTSMPASPPSRSS